jgi:hypothetical protein
MKNEICAATMVRGLCGLLAACLMAFVSPTSLARQDVKAKYNVAGRWQGKFPVPEDSSASDAENPVAIEVSIKDDAGKLSGATVFYVIRNKDNKPQVVGKAESEVIDPQFDGTTLRFSVKSKGPQPGKETRIDMQMKLTSATEAELENLNDNSSPPFQMKKVQ